jgi:hypothetical protein
MYLVAYCTYKQHILHHLDLFTARSQNRKILSQTRLWTTFWKQNRWSRQNLSSYLSSERVQWMLRRGSMQNRILWLCCKFSWGKTKHRDRNGYFCFLSVSVRTHKHGLSSTQICHQLLDWHHTLVESKLHILEIRKIWKFKDDGGTDSGDR